MNTLVSQLRDPAGLFSSWPFKHQQTSTPQDSLRTVTVSNLTVSVSNFTVAGVRPGSRAFSAWEYTGLAEVRESDLGVCLCLRVCVVCVCVCVCGVFSNVLHYRTYRFRKSSRGNTVKNRARTGNNRFNLNWTLLKIWAESLSFQENFFDRLPNELVQSIMEISDFTGTGSECLGSDEENQKKKMMNKKFQ